MNSNSSTAAGAASQNDFGGVGSDDFHRQPSGPPTFTNSGLRKAPSDAGGPPTFYRNKGSDERDTGVSDEPVRRRDAGPSDGRRGRGEDDSDDASLSREKQNS